MFSRETMNAPSAVAILEIVATVFPKRRVTSTEPLPEGISNFNYKVDLDSGEPVVLRIYGRDPAVCQKEIDVLGLVRHQIPVPEILHANLAGLDMVGPYLVTRFVEGITFRRLRATRDSNAMAEAAGSIGETLAAIGRIDFDRSGRPGPDPCVVEPFLSGPNAIPVFVEGCFSSPVLRDRLDEPARERVRRAVWACANELGSLENEGRLVHRDFNNRNVLVRCKRGRWQVAAVLDWEFAVSGSPLVDIGSFLRYETDASPSREPHFSRGYVRGGGELREDWRYMARLVDLASLCELLTESDAPAAIVAEVCALVRAPIHQEVR
jgi:aminoglycoside phosphotransferase (APT) family kinase protein